MSAEDTELFEASKDAGFDEDAAAGVEEGFGCVVGAEVDAGSDGFPVPFRSAAGDVGLSVLPEEGVGTTEDGFGLEEGGPQV
jgi:hypothetical protein